MTHQEHTALNARIDALQAQVDALITRLDSMLANEPDDPTQRIVPIPEPMLLYLPDLPVLKTRWVGRGTFEGMEIPCEGQWVYWWNQVNCQFERAHCFSDPHFHIEAV